MQSVPTIFLHGFSGEGAGLRRFADVHVGTSAVCLDLPGFGGTEAPARVDVKNIREYCSAVWSRIRTTVPVGPVRLVGHSHGAMVGYVLALQHPQEVTELELFCPVARPRLLPRLAIRCVRLLRSIGVPPELLIRLAAHPAAVSLVSRYTFSPDWTATDRARILQMRRREARFYSPIMLDLMEQALRFTESMRDSRCTVPTRIYHMSDDNVAGDDDVAWYEDRVTAVEVRELPGGHLCIVANPERTVALFGPQTVQ